MAIFPLQKAIILVLQLHGTHGPTNKRKNEPTNQPFLFTYTCCPTANTVEAAQ